MAAKTMEWRPGPTVCRCCLAEGCYKDISTEYFWMGKREVYSEMLSETFSVSIAYSTAGGPNSNSRLICEPCISRLRDASDFKRQVQECERTFMQHLDPGSTSTAGCELTVEPEDVKIETVKLEAHLSDVDVDDGPDFGDDDDDDLDDEPLTKFATKVPKKESVDLLDLIDNSKAAEKRKSTTKVKATPAKKTKKETVKPTSSKPKPEKKKKGSAFAEEESDIIRGRRGRKLKENVSERQLRRRRRANNELPEESDKRIAKTMMRRNAITLLECSTAWAFRWFHGTFYCSYCDHRFADIDPLREHVLKNHIGEQPTKKIFTKLTENNMVKIDIGNLLCRICNCYIENIDSLKDHLVSIHKKNLFLEYSDGVLPFKLQMNSFYCQICFEHFDTFSKVNEHMNSHYQNYICEECGKAFVSKSRFRRHVQSHEIGSFPCADCKEIFGTRVARMCHRMKVHRKGVRYTCPRCPEMFTNYYSRAKHLVDEHGQQKIDYDCPACGKTYETASKRAAHFRMTHTNVDRRYKCSQCNSSFVTKSKLQRHSATHMRRL
ncbi:zinc finger protein 667-like isoform X14 [Achroia grisella]|uniref:zinc finger protein 667-like isoform X14 n=1 Tax=Achroia grisella TaxID=688607 RepID=UPI0027D33054|nr:zinc finger protein 667-like isoform X14 [Achroia grisella]